MPDDRPRSRTLADLVAFSDLVNAIVGRYPRPAPTNTPTAPHRCCGDRPPIDETVWLRYGHIVDTDGVIYTGRGEPTTRRMPRHLMTGGTP